METIIKVNGMTCGHCKQAVESALNKLNGVSLVEVHLDKGEVKVGFDEGKLTLNHLQDAIEEQGYDVI